MITGDKFYTCDDAERIALRLARNVSGSYRTVTPHSHVNTLRVTLAASAGAPLFLDFMNQLPLVVFPSQDLLFTGTLNWSVLWQAFPVGEFTFNPILIGLNNEDAGQGMSLYLADGGEPPSSRLIAPQFLPDLLFNGIQIIASTGIASSLDVELQLQFTGYKISK